MSSRLVRFRVRWIVVGICACLGLAWLFDYYVLTPAVMAGLPGAQALQFVDPQGTFTFVFSKSGRRVVVSSGSEAHDAVLGLLMENWVPGYWTRQAVHSSRWQGIEFVTVEQNGHEKLRLYGRHVLVPCKSGYWCYRSDALIRLKNLVRDLRQGP
jgi:hypothetical protein